MLLYIIRHGETKWNALGKIQGTADIPLNENGLKLAEITGQALLDIPFDFAISSPLQRAYRTAELVLGGRKIPIYTDARIQEIDFGVMEGKCIHTNDADEFFNKFLTDPYHFIPEESGETIQQVCDRTRDFWKELISKKEWQDKTVLIATHGCSLRGILHNVYEDVTDYWHGGVCPNCGVNIVEVKNGQGTLIAADKVYY